MSDIIASTTFFVVATTLVKFVVFVLLFVLPLAALLTWMERRQSAYMQDRLGPTRAHFMTLFGKPLTLGGLVHVLADALKMFFKEHFVPLAIDKIAYHIAPAIGFVASLMIIALIPFGPDIHTGWGGIWAVIPMQIARIDSGLLMILAIGSLGMYGAALAGWSSNNRFALLGGLRASAQSISYEIALGLTLVGMLLISGSAELSHIVTAQGGFVWHHLLPRWGIFLQPLAAILFLVAAIAETKRIPFDLPEGESEIIGYFVEYSSMGFGMFMLGEFIEVVVLSCIFTCVFLGGWQLPWVLGNHSLTLGFMSITLNPWLHALLAFIIFASKVFFMCALQLQLRWSLPRFRYDQLMHIGWKKLLPLSLLNIFATATLIWLDVSLESLVTCNVILIVVFMLIVIAGPSQHVHTVQRGEAHGR